MRRILEHITQIALITCFKKLRLSYYNMCEMLNILRDTNLKTQNSSHDFIIGVMITIYIFDNVVCNLSYFSAQSNCLEFFSTYNYVSILSG